MALAEQLVGEARERRKRRLDSRERVVESVSAGAFIVVASTIALGVSSVRRVDLVVALGLVVGYAIFTRVRFEVGEYNVSAAQLAFVPMLILLPYGYVPLLVAAGLILSSVPEFIDRSWHRQRWISLISDSWFCVPPVLLLAAVGPGSVDLGDAPVYVLAFCVQVAADLIWGITR